MFLRACIKKQNIKNGRLIARHNSSSIMFPKLSDVKINELLKASPYGKGKYYIERSETGNFPVYSDYKAGGNKMVTEIRGIRGDAVQLRNDLQRELPYISKKLWKVLPTSHKIIITGNFVRPVKQVFSQIF